MLIYNKFPTYTFPCVMSSLTIRLAYDLSHLFPFFLLKQESKEGKTQTKLYYMSRTRLQGLISLSKLSKRKDQTKLLFI